MTDSVKPIPDGYEAATPYLCVKGAVDAIEFYKQAFGATETMRMADTSGRVGHAELRIGNALVMLADEFPEMGFVSPKTLGGTPVSISLYVQNVDAFVERAVAAGATLKRPVQNQFYGDRTAGLEDPFGHAWHFATHVEDVAPDEMHKRFEAAHGGS